MSKSKAGWRNNALYPGSDEAYDIAEDEGMGGGEHAYLQRVQEALGRLQRMDVGQEDGS